jgi:hypothetical protein
MTTRNGTFSKGLRVDLLYGPDRQVEGAATAVRTMVAPAP